MPVKRGLYCPFFKGELCKILCTGPFSPENRNQDRSQCKPLSRRNSDLQYWRIPRQFLYFTPINPPPPLQTYGYIASKRDSYYTVVWEAAEKLMALVRFFLGGGGYRQMYASESVNRSLFFRQCKGLHWLLSWFLFSAFCLWRFYTDILSTAKSASVSSKSSLNSKFSHCLNLL